MKHLLFLTIGICLSISVPAMADQAEDEAAIRAAMEQIAACYNAHDAKACAALIDEDFQNWEGTVKGRADAEKNSSHRNSSRIRTSKRKFSKLSALFL